MNGTEITAFCSTQARISVLDPQAAKQAGIETVSDAVTSKQEIIPKRGRQEFGNEILTVIGVDGGMVNLYGSKSTVCMQAEDVSLG